MSHSKLHPSTLCIHGGQSNCEVTGAVMPPIYTSSTYAQESPGVHKGFEYSRSHNATRYAFERAIAILEGTGIAQEQDPSMGGLAFSSGLAASATCLELLEKGSCFICMDDVYGGTNRLLNQVRATTQGLDIEFVNLSDPSRAAEAIRSHKPAMIWLETPSNPTLKIVDIAAVAAEAAKVGALTVVDNTFATPMLQQPLQLGADIVVHSGTKYIGGHSDVVCGVLATNKLELAQRLRFLQNAVGSILGPFDSYLALRGTKTLAVRMRQHCESAMKIARWLEDHPSVSKVIYPGLDSHPQHDVATRQMSLDGNPAYGGMITAILEGGIDRSRRFLEQVNLFTLAESLGGVESLIEHPAIMTHASVPEAARAELGIDDGLVRLSVGIEQTDDLIDDLSQALN